MINDTRRIPLIAGGVALILVVVWYFMLWSPQAKKLTAAHKAQAAAEQHIGQLQSQVVQLHGLVKQIPADTARFSQLEAALPDNPSLDQALDLLHQAAVSSGVIVTTLGPSGAAGASQAPASAGSGGSAGGEPSVTLNMTVQGSNAQIRSFLTGLENLSRVVVVDKLVMAGGAIGTATIQARVFYAGQPTP